MNTQLNFQTINSENSQRNELNTQFASLLNKILSGLNEKLFDQLNQNILQTCRVSTQKSYKVLAQIIQSLVKKLANRIQSLQSLVDMEITKSDYESLQASLQKSQAQIRMLFKIQHQQKICQQDLQEKLHEKTQKLKQAQKTIKFYKNKHEKQKKELLKKLDFYQQKLYSQNRQGRNSDQKSTQNKLLHKASLHFKDKSKLQPYLENLSKSKHVLVRRRQASKIFKDKGSKFFCFQSLKDKESQISVQKNCSISFQATKVRSGNSFSQLHSSIQLKDPVKKKKNRVLKNLTELSDQ